MLDTRQAAEYDPSEGPDPIDVHVGLRLQRRREILGMTQEKLAKRIGVSFQQVQKYERGLNRISASRMFDAAIALEVSVAFFFDDMSGDMLAQRKRVLGRATAGDQASNSPSAVDPMQRTESLEVLRNYYSLTDRQRAAVRSLVDSLARAS